jgi:hypothetical protein
VTAVVAVESPPFRNGLKIANRKKKPRIAKAIISNDQRQVLSIVPTLKSTS